MAQVEVTVNGRNYVVACEDGEEDHLLELAAYINGYVGELAESLGQVGEARLILMAGLLMADELFDAVGRVEGLQKEVDSLHAAKDQALSEADSARGRDASSLSARIEDIAARLESA